MQRAELVSGAFYLDRQPEVRRSLLRSALRVCLRASCTHIGLTIVCTVHCAMCAWPQAKHIEAGGLSRMLMSDTTNSVEEVRHMMAKLEEATTPR
jgi:hypothetical protein